jgi:4-hydroxythreonine-4-phosphate dehydrogenase
MAAGARIAVSVGCPCGIGPEVSVAAAAELAKETRLLLVGGHDVVDRALKARGLGRRRFVHVERADDAWSLPRGVAGVWDPIAFTGAATPGKPTPEDGAAQLAWVDAACDLAACGSATAMVTGPVSKEVIASSPGREAKRFLGHTEHLQRRLGAKEVVMAFANERFTTALVTTHLPIAKVPRAITPDAVASATYWLARLLLDLKRGKGKPRIAVCSLNPHAGEGGLLGGEEAKAIAPGISRAIARLERPTSVVVEGPRGAETLFRYAHARGAYDGIVAMYHDQATIPMKLVGFGESVNVSLGLPIVRTSVDHGTGYDIAGRGIADPRGMREAILLAARLTPRSTAARAGTSTRPASRARRR